MANGEISYVGAWQPVYVKGRIRRLPRGLVAAKAIDHRRKHIPIEFWDEIKGKDSMIFIISPDVKINENDLKPDIHGLITVPGPSIQTLELTNSGDKKYWVHTK